MSGVNESSRAVGRAKSGSAPAASRRTLFRDDICACIREEILSCELPPSAEIDGQKLAHRFGVSMSPVRDALHRLHAEGLVDVRPRRGYYVSSISLEDALELYEVRIVLEAACVERTARAASDADLESLARRSRELAVRSQREWIRHNREFHLYLASLCGNSRLISMTREVILAFDRLTMASISRTQGGKNNDARVFSALDQEHGELVAALKGRDAAQAIKLIRTHIELARTRFLESYKSTRQG